MPSIEYDLRYLKAALVDLEGYLLSQEVYWPIGIKPPRGDPPYPRLTLGGILISRQNLAGRAMNAAQGEQYKDLIRRLEDTRSKWRTAWGSKSARNFSARLNQWTNFMEDYRKEPENNVDRYGYEVRGRVMLALLQPESVEIRPAEIEAVKGLDSVLKNSFLEGNFIWDAELIPSYPNPQFWYLYGRLSKTILAK